MEKITDLQLLKIVTEDGRHLGHVFDLRSQGVPEHGLSSKERIITEIVYGTIGLWERLGLKQSKTKTLAWQAVIAIKDRKIIVANEVAKESPK
jgi:sporulation protein YlmC with PRC-barrel domain